MRNLKVVQNIRNPEADESDSADNYGVGDLAYHEALDALKFGILDHPRRKFKRINKVSILKKAASRGSKNQFGWFLAIRSTSSQYSGWPWLASVAANPRKSMSSRAALIRLFMGNPLR
jgi:hypothetical protein